MSSRRISPTAARPASVIIQRANWRSALSAATTLEGARNVPAAAGSGTSPQPPAARPPRSGPTRRRRACPPAPARGQGRRSPGWHGTHAGEVVDVGCFSSGGGRENRSFGVSYVRSGNLLGAGGLTSARTPTPTAPPPRSTSRELSMTPPRRQRGRLPRGPRSVPGRAGRVRRQQRAELTLPPPVGVCVETGGQGSVPRRVFGPHSDQQDSCQVISLGRQAKASAMARRTAARPDEQHGAAYSSLTSSPATGAAAATARPARPYGSRSTVLHFPARGRMSTGQLVKTQRRRRTDWSRPIAIMSANMAEPAIGDERQGQAGHRHDADCHPDIDKRLHVAHYGEDEVGVLLRNEAARDQPAMEQAGAASVWLDPGIAGCALAASDAVLRLPITSPKG